MNENVSNYKVIKNFENHLKIIEKLELENIDISHALDLEMDVFKSHLADFDESKIESFIADLKIYKDSQNTPLTNGFNLKELIIVEKFAKNLIENELTLDDTYALMMKL